jgi:phosphoribosylformylglycinamidine synthase
LETFRVEVVIQNKPYIRDPEGETILRDLVSYGGFSAVKEIRTAKLLRMVVEAESPVIAAELVTKMCKNLRIYNPVVSSCSVTSSD